jgi:hypothetical protein
MRVCACVQVKQAGTVIIVNARMRPRHLHQTELLRRTEEKKDERKKERLDSYNRRGGRMGSCCRCMLRGMLHARQPCLLSRCRVWLHSGWPTPAIRHPSAIAASPPTHLPYPATTVFRDYFEFDAGSPEAARARGLSPETAAAIRKWMDDNDEQKMPGLMKKD